MVGVPQLRGNENIFARDPPSDESYLQGLAYLALVPVALCTIEVSKSRFQRACGSAYRRRGIGNQGAKPEYGHMARSIVEPHSHTPKIRRFDHDGTSAVSRVEHHRPDR